MKKSLYFAFLLLTLLVVTDAKAQNYSSESYANTTCTSQSVGIWCKAQQSSADIYTEEYDDDWDYDYSKYGDLSHEVVHSDGTHDYLNYDTNAGSTYDNTNQTIAGSSGSYGYSTVNDDFASYVTWSTVLEEVVVTGSAPLYYYCSYCGLKLTKSEWLTHNCLSSLSQTGSINDNLLPEGAGGGSESSDKGENDQDDNPKTVGWYPPSNIDKWKLYNVKDLKFIPNIHLVKNLPDKFQRQGPPMECVANSIAIAAGIIDGTDPEITRSAIRDIAKNNNINLNDTKNGGIPLGKIRTMLYDYCAILDDNKFSRNVVESHIDNENKPIMAVTEVEFTNEKGEYFLGAHMVTIVGYDAMYYYCAVGKEEAAAVPKSEFEIKNTTNNAMRYRLFIYNGKKRVNQ